MSTTNLVIGNKKSSPLMTFKNIIKTKSSQIKDIYISSRHKQKLPTDINVIKENTRNMLLERKDNETVNNKNQSTTIKNSDRSSTQQTLIKGGNARTYSSLPLDNKTEKSKQRNITIISRHSNCHISNIDQPNNKSVDIKNHVFKIPKVPPKPNNTFKQIANNSSTSSITRPQTPMFKKSVDIRNEIRENSKATNIKAIKISSPKKNFINKTVSNISFSNADNTTKSPTKSKKSINSPQNDVLKATKHIVQCKNDWSPELPQQLLHPTWRRIPHNQLYGWSEKHSQLESILHKKIKTEEIESIYFKSEEDYELHQSQTSVRLLQKPIVRTAAQVLQILHCYEVTPDSLPKLETNKFRYNYISDTESESGYDGDDE